MPLDLAETVGERLQRLREEKGVDSEQLVAGLISPEMLLIIEHNMSLPSVGVMRELATRLGVTVDYFHETANKMRKRRVWEQIGTAMFIEGRNGILFQHTYFPRQWLFGGDIVLADTMKEAISKLTQHARLMDFFGKGDYWLPVDWKSIEKRHLPSLRMKGTRDKVYRHRLEIDLWKWNDFVCYALTYEEWYQTVMREVVAKLRSFA